VPPKDSLQPAVSGGPAESMQIAAAPGVPPDRAPLASVSPLGIVSAWVALSIIWGSTWLAIKVGLRDLPPLWFVAIRFVVAATVLFGICLGRFRLRPSRRDEYLFLAATGVLMFSINYGLLFWGEEQISSGLASVLQATIPIFGLLFAHLYLPAERLRWTKLVGALVGLAGVALICWKVLDVQGSLAVRGGLAIIGGAVACAYANVLTKLRGGGFAPAALAAWQMLCGVVPLLVLACWEEGSPWALHWSLVAVGCLLYLALVGSALAFLLYYWLMQRVAVTKLQTLSLITPPLAVVFGWLAGGEELSRWTLAGGAFVLTGVGLIFWRVPEKLPADLPAGSQRY
jgi:drug/metabolite transporter (DMT)-like permease